MFKVTTPSQMSWSRPVCVLVRSVQALGGVIGLAFSVPELISNCKDLDKCDTTVSKILREDANAIQSTAEQMKEELDEIQ